MFPRPTTPTTASPLMRPQSRSAGDGARAANDHDVSRRVFAVRYAHRDARRAEHFYGPDPPDPHDAPMPMDYYLWAITGDDAPPVVVDAGFRPETARRRGCFDSGLRGFRRPGDCQRTRPAGAALERRNRR